MTSLPLKGLNLRLTPIVLVLTILIFSAGRRETDSALPMAAYAAQLEAAKPPLIRVQSNLVRVPVSITDASGNPAVDLELKDFRIEEDGRLMALTRLAKPGIIPLELALVLDISASVQSCFEFEVQSATRFLHRIIKPGDNIIIITIGSHPRLIQPVTGNIDEAFRSLGTIVASRESTALYDTLVMATGLLQQSLSPESRRVQIVISDGEDNSSEAHKLEDVLHEIQHADCIMYAINPAGPSIMLNNISTEGQRALQSLAGETGGTTFLPDGSQELEVIFDRIAGELSTQYLLEYYSDRRADGSFRKIDVRVPGRSGLRIRSRQGYYSGNS